MNPALRVWSNPTNLCGSDLRVSVPGASPEEAVMIMNGATPQEAAEATEEEPETG